MKNDAAALSRQVGGTHYKDMPIQPIEYIHKNQIGFFEGSVIKYVSRWRAKGGIEDLKKARHFLDLLIDFEAATTPASTQNDACSCIDGQDCLNAANCHLKRDGKRVPQS